MIWSQTLIILIFIFSKCHILHMGKLSSEEVICKDQLIHNEEEKSYLQENLHKHASLLASLRAFIHLLKTSLFFIECERRRLNSINFSFSYCKDVFTYCKDRRLCPSFEKKKKTWHTKILTCSTYKLGSDYLHYKRFHFTKKIHSTVPWNIKSLGRAKF